MTPIIEELLLQRARLTACNKALQELMGVKALPICQPLIQAIGAIDLAIRLELAEQRES